MAVPKRIVVTCPGCDMPLELTVCNWELGRAMGEGDALGVGINLAAWTAHDCDRKS